MNERTDGPDDGLAEKVDELEEKVFGERENQRRDEDDDPSPAFEQDVDLDDEARRETGSGVEPPA